MNKATIATTMATINDIHADFNTPLKGLARPMVDYRLDPMPIIETVFGQSYDRLLGGFRKYKACKLLGYESKNSIHPMGAWLTRLTPNAVELNVVLPNSYWVFKVRLVATLMENNVISWTGFFRLRPSDNWTQFDFGLAKTIIERKKPTKADIWVRETYDMGKVKITRELKNEDGSYKLDDFGNHVYKEMWVPKKGTHWVRSTEA